MTLIVGILCKDGVVIGADSSITFAYGPHPSETTIEQTGNKIFINDSKDIINAGSGEVGLGQRANSVIEQFWNAGTNKNKNYLQIGTLISAEVLKNFNTTFILNINQNRQPCVPYSSLFAFYSEHQFHLCEFGLDKYQPEFKIDVWYASIGSGQKNADTLLGLIRKIFWADGQRPQLKQGIFAALWVLQTVIDINTGGINGPARIATLTKPDNKPVMATILNETDMSGFNDYVVALEEHIREFPKQFEKSTAEIPKPQN